jgi:hypothetical protein
VQLLAEQEADRGKQQGRAQSIHNQARADLSALQLPDDQKR